MVEIESGRLRGLATNGALRFLGIPYAADTSGARRFMAPQPVPGWAGVRDATRLGDRCPQTLESFVQIPVFSWYDQQSAFSENCCVLNVFTPGLASGATSGARRPVIVYIHGGGYSSGGGGGPALDGSRLAAFGDVVVVTVNHRLNLFGYMPLGHLGDPAFDDAGHAGQLDLVAALHWVQRNIHAFGGDADNVTLVGQSGGGNKIMVLLMMPAARGLFHRAINTGGASGLQLSPPEPALPYVDAMLQRLDLAHGPLRRLQELPVEVLQRARQEAIGAARYDGAEPVVDGRHVLASPFSAEGLALQASVPLMIGTTATEATLFLAQDRRNLGIDGAQLIARIQAQFGMDALQARALVAAYREDDPARSDDDVLAHLASDVLARGPLLRAAEAKAALGAAPVYVYNFAWQVPEDGGIWRSPHTADIPFAFGTLDCARGMTGPDHDGSAAEASRHLMSAFVGFARNGDPGGAQLPAWPPYDARRRATMVIDRHSRVFDDFNGAARRASAQLQVGAAPATIRRGALFRGVR